MRDLRDELERVLFFPSVSMWILVFYYVSFVFEMRGRGVREKRFAG